MLKRIIIKNFQSHSNTVISLGHTLNYIVGVSDSGKSAIRRAIQCVTRRGPFYLKYGETDGSVVLEFDDCTVSREFKKVVQNKCPHCKEKISKKDNKCPSCEQLIPIKPALDVYYVDDEMFDKFGTQLPPMITEKLRMCEAMFGDFPVNISIQHQFEDMFFIGNTYNGSARNKMIMALVPDAERVDSLLKELSSEKTEKRNELRYLEKEQEVISTKIDLVKSDFAELDSIYIHVNKLEKEITVLQVKLQDLTRIKEQLEQTRNIGKVKQFFDKHGEVPEKASLFLDKIQIRKTRLDSIIDLHSSITELSLLDTELPVREELEVKEVGVIEKVMDTLVDLKKVLNQCSNLKLLNVVMPVFKEQVTSTLVQSLEKMNSDLLGLNKDTTAVELAKHNIEKLSTSIVQNNTEKESFQATFKQENCHLICPHRNDIYADECLLQFVK